MTSTTSSFPFAAHSNLPPTPPSEPNTLDVSSKANMASNPAYPSTDTGVRRIAPTLTKHRHIWVITGPAGCGKTSVAEFLHSTFGFTYLEGDTFHPPENVQKMASGQPLTDADRWDWLVVIREQAVQTLEHITTETSASGNGVIVTCSALKRKYRDVLRVASYYDPSILVHFVFLNASEALLLDRVRARRNHYMKDDMVHSQFQGLETPQTDEVDVLSVDASGTSVEVQKLAAAVVQNALTKDAVPS